MEACSAIIQKGSMHGRLQEALPSARPGGWRRTSLNRRRCCTEGRSGMMGFTSLYPSYRLLIISFFRSASQCAEVRQRPEFPLRSIP